MRPLFLILIPLLAVGCASKESSSNVPPKEAKVRPAATAPPATTLRSSTPEPATGELQRHLLVTADWVDRHQNNDDVVIIHVADDRRQFINMGHLPSARFLGLYQILEDREGVPNELPPPDKLQEVFRSLGIENDDRIILYDSEKGLSAARAFFTLDYLGAGDRTALMDGQLIGWKLSGKAVSYTMPSDPEPGNFTASVQEERRITLEELQALRAADDPELLLVDARPEEEYSGQITGPKVTRGGHIPGARSVFWQDHFLKEGPVPALKDEAKLREPLEHGGRKIVTYGRNGREASVAYFVARYLGLDVGLYDGSFLEWSKNPALEVATGLPED